MWYPRYLKRFVDLSITIPLIVVISPVLMVLASCIFVTLGRPVLFRQRRPGRNGKLFWILKFRTMTDACDANGRLLSDGVRLTRLGQFLRSTSLDELPALWNVLKGEMSLVGPRPLLVEYLDLYTPEQSQRHQVVPGMTGWAQVNGRNAIDWETKFELDVWYVHRCSLWLDLAILFKTFVKVVRRDDINAVGEATTKAFAGSKSDSVTNFRSAA